MTGERISESKSAMLTTAIEQMITGGFSGAMGNYAAYSQERNTGAGVLNNGMQMSGLDNLIGLRDDIGSYMSPGTYGAASSNSNANANAEAAAPRVPNNPSGREENVGEPAFASDSVVGRSSALVDRIEGAGDSLRNGTIDEEELDGIKAELDSIMETADNSEEETQAAVAAANALTAAVSGDSAAFAEARASLQELIDA